MRLDLALLVIAAFALLWYIGPILLLIFGGILLAIAIDGLAQILVERARLLRGVALAVVIGLLILIVVAGIVFVIPTFMEQVGQVWEQLGRIAGRVQDWLQEREWARQLLGVGEETEAEWSVTTGDIASRVATAMMTVLTAVAALIVMFAIALFLTVNPALYRAGLLKLFPLAHRSRAEEVLATIGYALRWWLIGQLVSMTVLGVATSLGLLLFGVGAWLGLGMLVGLMTFVPFLGPIIAGIPVLIISFAEGLQTGLLVLAFYLVLQNFEGNFLTPLIQQQAVHMPPALLISTQIVMATIFGFAGLMLAAPLAVVGLVVVNLVYVEDVLGDRPTEI